MIATTSLRILSPMLPIFLIPQCENDGKGSCGCGSLRKISTLRPISWGFPFSLFPYHNTIQMTGTGGGWVSLSSRCFPSHAQCSSHPHFPYSIFLRSFSSGQAPQRKLGHWSTDLDLFHSYKTTSAFSPLEKVLFLCVLVDLKTSPVLYFFSTRMHCM